MFLGLGVTMAASPSARSAILEFLGLKSARIERREPTATPPPTPPASLGTGLQLGERVALDRARREVRFRVVVPRLASLGEPDAVYFGETFSGAETVSLVYGRRPGIRRSPHTGASLLVMEVVAVASPVIEKATGAGAMVDRFEVDGQPAIFISGRPHGFALQTPEGGTDFEEQRLAGNTLLLERPDGVLLRVEGEVSRAEAVRIARSAR